MYVIIAKSIVSLIWCILIGKFGFYWILVKFALSLLVSYKSMQIIQLFSKKPFSYKIDLFCVKMYTFISDILKFHTIFLNLKM